jgi:multiple sugar transport system permease protein
LSFTAGDRRNLLKGVGFVSPWLVGFSVFLLAPIVLALYLSMCDWSLSQQRPPVFVGLENFADLFHDAIFWKVLGNTLVYAAIAIPAGLLVSLGLALMLNTQVPGQPLFRTIIFLPSLVPVVASAMLWLWLFNARLGLINILLSYVGISGPGWLIKPQWALPALAIMALWGVGHTVVIFLAGLQDVPRELYEAAEMDGATPLARLRHVTLPMISPVIFFNLVMSIIGTFQVFTVPYIMTQGGPDRATYFFSMYLFDNAFHFPGRMGYASAMAFIQLMIILTLTAVAFWTSKRWVHYQGK